MHDPEFEKEVQKKMEELEFSPSEGVWMNLQRGLHKEQRRRAPLFWLFFLLGGVLLGAGGASLFYFHKSAATISGGSGIAGSGSTGTNTGTNTGTTIDAGAAGNTETLPATTSPVLAAGATTRTSGTAGSGKTGSANISSGNIRSENARPENAGSGNAVSGNAVSGNAVFGNAGSANTNDRSFFAATTGVISEQQEGAHPSITHRTVVAPTRLTLHKDLLSADIFYQPGRNMSDPKKMNVPMTMFSAPMNKRSAKKARFSTHPSWEAGFAGGGGFSSAVIPGSSSAPASNPSSGLSNLALSLQTSSSPGGHVELRISKIQPDLSFWAGIFVQRPVMKRLSFSAGLNLHYYSTRLETVEQKGASSLSTTPNTTPFLFNSSPYVQPAAQGSPYYAPENYKFSNRYYFLQLPLSLQWQVNRSRKTPVFWEGGLALSRLISANALYYNEKSGMYYKDGGAANPNHLMAFSSLVVGLSLHGNSIKIGPEGQYGLTSLINAGNVGSQHLYYGGIKITVIPRKW